MNTTSLEFRRLPYWEKVELQEQRIPFSGCHIFTGSIVGKGYGIVRENGGYKLVHRASWERANGPIPAGLFVLHRCDIPSCFNPDHLFVGTILENNQDRERKGRGGQLSGKDHLRPTAKLNDSDVHEIRTILSHDQTHGIGNWLAKKYGVSQAVISGIRHNRHWRHVA